MMGVKEMVSLVNDGGKVTIGLKFPSKVYGMIAPFKDIILKI